jgi:hypothetical protein
MVTLKNVKTRVYISDIVSKAGPYSAPVHSAITALLFAPANQSPPSDKLEGQKQ